MTDPHRIPGTPLEVIDYRLTAAIEKLAREIHELAATVKEKKL